MKEKRNYIFLGKDRIEKANRFVHLRKPLTRKISRRVGMCWKAYNRFRRLIRSKIEIIKKIKLWKSTVIPVLTHGCETFELC